MIPWIRKRMIWKLQSRTLPDSNHHIILSQEFPGTEIPDWGGNKYGSNRKIRPPTYADKTKKTAKLNENFPELGSKLNENFPELGSKKEKKIVLMIHQY